MTYLSLTYLICGQQSQLFQIFTSNSHFLVNESSSSTLKITDTRERRTATATSWIRWSVCTWNILLFAQSYFDVENKKENIVKSCVNSIPWIPPARHHLPLRPPRPSSLPSVEPPGEDDVEMRWLLNIRKMIENVALCSTTWRKGSSLKFPEFWLTSP